MELKYNMFELNNIITYTTANIQIIGVFIAIIGGLVATKILNTKIEKDTLIEKLSKLEKEIRFYKAKKLTDENEIYEINKKDYIIYIYEKIKDKNFDIEDYDDYNLTIEQRKSIIQEIKDMMNDALKIFSVEHSGADVSNILQQNHIRENTIEYMIYEYVGKETRKRKASYFGMIDPADIDLPNLHQTSLSENLEERDLNNRIDKFGEFIEWKIIEKEDIESKISAINNIDVKKDVILFIVVTVFAIIIPQLVLCIYPIFINFKFLKYIFAIYSILVFIISMILMLWYMLNLLFSISKK